MKPKICKTKAFYVSCDITMFETALAKKMFDTYSNLTSKLKAFQQDYQYMCIINCQRCMQRGCRAFSLSPVK